jgi:DNA-binding SARP family transcriptional activator
VSGIRSALRACGASDHVVRTYPSAYALNVAPEQIDARRFEQLVHDGLAFAAEDPRRTRQLLEEALTLWRGSPLAEAEQAASARLETDRLDELRLTATECLLGIRLASGEDAELVGTLQGLVSRHPLRDKLRRQLMLALYRSGRQSEALAAYRDGCAALDELGLLPSRDLRALEEAILRHDASLETRAAAAPVVGPVLLPARMAPPPGDELPLLGRGEAMARLVALLEDSEDGDRRQLVVLSGEPGIGKTRLLREFAALATANGHLVPFTSAADDDILPYRPFSELIRAVAASPNGHAYLDQLGGLASDLALLVPELTGSPVRPSADPELTRTRLFEGVVRLAGAAAEHPLVVLIDDAHSMGRATGALVRALLGSCDRRRLAIVLAARDEQQQVGSGLHDVLRQFEAVTIWLDPLSEADLEAWLEWVHRKASEEGGPTRTAAELCVRTGGVPLLVQAALGHDADEDRLSTERVRIESLVAHRRAGLTREADDVLEVAAVAGLEVDPHLIAAVIGASSQAVRDSLDEIVLAGRLLISGSRPDSYLWYHGLVREAVLRSVPLGKQTRWRGELSGVLSDQGFALHAARHALDALHGQTRVGLRTVLLGVDEAIDLLAFETGEDLCRRALALAGARVDAEIAVSLLIRLGLCLAFTARRQAADDAWRDAVERARRAHRSDLLARIALATEPVGRAFADTPLRWELLQEAMALPDLDSRLRIEVSCAWLEEAVMPHRAIANPDLATRIVRDARRQGDLDLLLRSLKTAHGVARATQQTRRELSTEICTLADRLDDAEWQAYGRVLAFIDALIVLDRRAAELHLDRFLRAAHAAASPRLRWNAAFVLATWDMLRGDLESSNRQACAAAELGQSYGMADAQLAMAIHGFFAAYHSGQLAAVSEPLAQYAAGHPKLLAFRAGAGLARAAAGDVRAAAAIRDELFPGITTPGVDETWPVAACLTAELCFATNAPSSQCSAPCAVLERYPGLMAVLGAGVAECGPVQRYLGLLTTSTDCGKARTLLKSAASACDQFGASVWTGHIERDLVALSDVVETTSV